MASDTAAGGKGIPRHVAIIMDGNGRWARARGLPRATGHRQGAKAARGVVEAAGRLGVSYLTLFSFSAENWRRPADEVSDLMGLLRRYLQSEIAELHRSNVRLLVIGERAGVPDDIVRMIEDAEAMTRGNDGLVTVMALNYGGRQEIVAAARDLAAAAARGAIDPAAIDGARFERALFTDGIPDPDLVLRTSGEQRLSNFLLWQSAYSELVFVDKLWPDFGAADLEAAIREYRRRDRRYGATASSG